MDRQNGNRQIEVYHVLNSERYRAEEGRTGRGDYIVLSLIALVALLLRIYGIDFGLPLHYHIDETRVMSRVVKMVSTGDLNPHFFHYPSFIFYYLCGLVVIYYSVHFVPFALGSIVSGKVPTLTAFKLSFDAAQADLYLLGRCSIALIGVLTVILLYFLVKRLFSRRAAAFASLALAVTPLHVLESHYIKQEVLMTFFMTLALYAGVRGEAGQKRGSSVLVGVAAGIAASVKYNGALVLSILPMLFRKGRRFILASFLGKGPIRTVLLAILIFLACSPFIALDYERFSTDFAYEMFHVSEKGHPGFDLAGDGIVYHRILYQILAAFPFSLGLPLYLVSLVGIVAGIWKKEEGFVWILFYAIPYFLLTSVMKVVFLRYYIPLVIGFCITAGYAFSLLTRRRGVAGKLACLVAAAVIVYTGVFTWSIERYMPRGRSTLDEGLRWVSENVAVGSTIAATHFTPPLSGETYDLSLMRPDQFTRTWLKEQQPDVIITSRLITVGFERGSEGTEEGREFIDGLRSGIYGYRRVADYRRDFMHSGLYGRLDPTYRDTFMPGVEIFVKEGNR